MRRALASVLCILGLAVLAGCGGGDNGADSPQLSPDVKYAMDLCEEGFLRQGNWGSAAEWADGANTFEEDGLDDREISDGCRAAQLELGAHHERSSAWLRGYIYGSQGWVKGSKPCSRIEVARRTKYYFIPLTNVRRSSVSSSTDAGRRPTSSPDRHLAAPESGPETRKRPRGAFIVGT
jgi:hypothetical protein